MEKKPHPKMLLIVTKRKDPSLNNMKGGYKSNNLKGGMTNIWKNKYWKHVAIAMQNETITTMQKKATMLQEQQQQWKEKQHQCEGK